MLLLLTWPQVCEVCPNHEVVMFQIFTATSPDLGSVAIVNIFFIFSARPVTTALWILCFTPGPAYYLPPIFHPSTLLHFICCTSYPLRTILGTEKMYTWTALTHANLRRPSLRFPHLPGDPWSSGPHAFDWHVPCPLDLPLSPSTCAEVLVIS